jgi:hypothetical protein
VQDPAGEAGGGSRRDLGFGSEWIGVHWRFSSRGAVCILRKEADGLDGQ